MGAAPSVVAEAAGAFGKMKELLDFDFAGTFDKLPLDTLCTVDLALGRIKDKLRAAMHRKCAVKVVLPAAAQALCDKSVAYTSEDHNRCIKDTVPYVVDIVRYAHASKPLKATLRRILGLGPWFTTNLQWAYPAWDNLQSGCVKHMRVLGDQLDALFQAQDLRARLGAYDPLRMDPSSPKASSAPLPAQFVPTQCAAHQFNHKDPCKNRDLECTYIHFLRLFALAVDDAFQKTVNATLKAADVRLVGGGVSSGGIKGYERMYNKMHSKDDHQPLPKPRPAHNIDVVRCLATFETIEDMRKCFECVQGVFDDGKYAKFKNGMAWDDEFAATRYHLRVVLATGKFSVPSRRTLGELRQDPGVQAAWAKYLESQPVPESVARGTWRRHVKRALEWIRHDIPDDTPMSMLCEVQMLLRDYTDARTAMHEVYKIVRADNPRSLGTDFAKYQRAANIRAKFDRDGDSEFNMACRDGLVVALSRLLAGGAVGPEHSRRGLYTACEYVRPECVELLVGKVQADHLGKALGFAAGGTPGRDGFDLTDARGDVVQLLLAAKADPDKAKDDGITPMILAAQEGHADALQLLLAVKADPDKARNDGNTPMNLAVENGHADARQLLLAAKADPDICMHGNGWSPVFVAAGAGHADAVRVLLAADPGLAHICTTGPRILGSQSIAAGTSRLEVANRLGHDECAGVLAHVGGT